ncbi:MAG: hypothetical protein CVU05_12710 [Bacteroidetes bacterium HGW-Bacteroidetes-21]|jgi:hypothetical protein|nr:MAG: hypothetical protein CVU05_12710 [Bacteroidetes bacterium HGW-Bacteroidetes-21]
MKKHFLVLLLIIFTFSAYSQKTLHVIRADANSLIQKMEDNSKVVNFTLSGFTSEHQLRVTEMFMRSYRGVEECNFQLDPATGIWHGTLKAYKYANNIYFSYLLEKAGFINVEFDNKVIPVENLKNSEL